MKLFRTIFVALMLTISADHVNGTQENLIISNTRSQLNSIFDTQGKVYVIVVARSNGNLKTVSYEGWAQLQQRRLENLSSGLLHIIKSLPKDALKIVVFNECFFQKTQPMPENDETSGSARCIIDWCKSISSLCENSLFYLNLLCQVPCAHAEHSKIIQKNRASYSTDKMFIDTKSLRRFPANYHQNADINGIFKNITYGIFDGEIATSYQKRSYCAEWNAGIATKFIYDFGSGKDIPHNEIGRKLIHKISTEICFDLCKGVRQSNNWKNGAMFARQSIFHVLQSNSINPICGTPPNDNKNRLPKDTIIVHADSKLCPSQDLVNTPLFMVSTNQSNAIIALNQPADYEIESTALLKPNNLLMFNAVTLLDETLTGYTGNDIITISIRRV